MKTLRMIGLLAMLCFVMPAFVSCDKDDDEPGVADAVIGTYSGTLNYSVMNYEPGNIEGTYEVKFIKDSNDADEVSVVLPECSFTPPIPQASSFTIPSITVNDVDVKGNGNVYIISEDEFKVVLDGTTYTGNISGTITGKDVQIKYMLRPGRMPMDINFTFEGTLK